MFDQKDTSKLISYWLRHNPNDGDLIADEFGWVSTEDLLKSLNLKGQKLDLNDIRSLNHSFDKIRWEFNEDESKIRATHGHSIPIVLSGQSVTPPKLLYHGTSTKKISSIVKMGILPMQRQFVHCSETMEMAIEVGKRHGKPIIIEIDAEGLSQEGSKFFKTSDNVWLTDKIPSDFISLNPWKIASQDEKTGLLKQLKTELAYGHILFDKTPNLELILRRHDCDDCLFLDNSDLKVYLVHLVWQGKQVDINCPWTNAYDSFSHWIENALIGDQKDYYLIY
ncbi:RNA 2'-phosphotransferase [uncultured Mucilaginibacter sp.]|uniref:RNA 2'-phosphotransferase n=1 Tax=uncultured Mucilaginibacter sp. TaxID=797541 RepID=UPI0025E063E5|nr:RNA 2'-phosphotransferase [uncultured Mucilaginibacter sp.]